MERVFCLESELTQNQVEELKGQKVVVNKVGCRFRKGEHILISTKHQHPGIGRILLYLFIVRLLWFWSNISNEKRNETLDAVLLLFVKRPADTTFCSHQ